MSFILLGSIYFNVPINTCELCSGIWLSYLEIGNDLILVGLALKLCYAVSAGLIIPH